MAVDLYWLGADHGSDYATVVIRCDTDETVTVVCNGMTFMGDSVLSVHDGVVKITVTGLAPGQKYPYSINGVPAGTLRTMKQSGEIWIAQGSCWSTALDDVLAQQLLSDYDIDLYIALGDFPYTNNARNAYGESTTSVTSSLANNQNAALYKQSHRQYRKITGIKELMRSVPFWYMPDDHEYCYDNGCPPDSDGGPSHLKWQTQVTGAEAGTYAQLQAAWSAALEAIDAYTIGNPVNVDAGIDADAKYSRLTIGPVEVFAIDCCRYRTIYNAIDDASKTMLGANQKSWAKTVVPASTAIFKLIASGKQLAKGGTNSDTWAPGAGDYVTERNELLWAWRDVVGMFVAAGDQHYASDQSFAQDELGEGYPEISCLVGCPTSEMLNATSVTGYPQGVKWKMSGKYDNSPHPQENVIALYKITQDRVYRYLLSTVRGLISCGYIDAGSNQVQYQRARIG